MLVNLASNIQMYKQAYDFNGIQIGTFDGTYLYNFSGEILVRIDGNEVYSFNQPCQYLGNFYTSAATKLDGSLLFNVSE